MKTGILFHPQKSALEMRQIAEFPPRYAEKILLETVLRPLSSRK